MKSSCLLAPSFEPVMFQPRSSLICTRTFLMGICHFQGSALSGPHSSGQYSGGPLCSSCQQAVWNTVKTFPEPVHLERVCLPSAWLTCSHSRARLWFLSAAPRVPNWFPIQAQCCLKSLWWWPTEVDNNGFRSEIRQISMFSRQDKQNFYGHWWEKNISCTRAVVFYILLQGYSSSIEEFKFRLSLTLRVQSMMH